MNAKKSVTLTGVAMAIAAGGGSHLALAGIDKGGKTQPIRSVARGTVSTFGSIYVNGVRFNTDGAVFIIDGEFGLESDLDVGQIVSVFGFLDEGGDSGTAAIVTYDDAVEGPVSFIDTLSNRLIVLGQTVIVNNDTAFSLIDGSKSVAGLQEQQVVEVSGYTDADGNVVATYIGDSATPGSYDVNGVVTGVDHGSQTFTINGLEIAYSDANLYALPFGAPQVGQQLEVVGAGMDASGRFDAEHVRAVSNAVAGQSGARGEVEGLITRRISLTDFDVDGITVRIRWGTQYANGSLFSLSPNRKVEVEGQFNAGGVLIADSIEFEREAELEHRGHVQAVYDNLIVVDGVQLSLTSETAFEDESDADERRFNVDNLRTGDFVSVRGYESNGTIVVTRLERDDDDDEEDGDD